MDKFPALLSFRVFVLIFKQTLRIDGSGDRTKDDNFVGIGANVDTGSQIGKGQRVAMQMAVDDFKVWFSSTTIKLCFENLKLKRNTTQICYTAYYSNDCKDDNDINIAKKILGASQS